MPLDRKQLADFIERKPELLCLLDKLQVGDIALLVEPIAGRRAAWTWQETSLLVKADGIDAQPGFLCDLSYLQ
jgi:hypothetical protein